MSWTGNHPATLEGIRVLDLTRLLPGPYCTALLADLGADVVKLEEPGQGDWARWVPPYYGIGPHQMGALFASINRGKRSLALNLKKKGGRALFLELVKTADVLVESFRPGVMDRLDLSADRLEQIRPGLIYCALTGYGQEGPYRDRAGHDLNYLAVTGALEQSGRADGPPHPPGFQAADLLGGTLYAALSILAALFHRQRTGEGARLDVAIAEGAATLMAPLFARIDAGEPTPPRGRDQLTGGFPCYNVYATADGRYLALGALEPKFWGELCQAVGHPEWIGLGHQVDSEVHHQLRALFATRSREEWLALLGGLEICLEPVLSPLEVLESEWATTRRLFYKLGGKDRPRTLQTSTPATPRTARDAVRPPPRLGEHTEEILAELGLTTKELSQLAGDGVIAMSQQKSGRSNW
ncbi:MAG: CoA transferase [Bradymonadales bacterium]|nr:CoA transferase [Bradymonadales bacterium]